MRYIVLKGLKPLPIKAKGLDGKLVDAPFGALDLVRWLIDNDKHFNSDGSGVRAGARIETQLEKAKHFLALEDADWVKLKEAADSPNVSGGMFGGGSNAYPVQPARRLEPFLTAIQDAAEKQPGEEPKRAKGKAA